METKYGFTKMNLDEFMKWIKSHRVGRTILSIQQHHTYSPDYSGFSGDNHFALQKSMKNYHVNHNGWSDIGQHFTTFPDGTILTGRSLELSPAGIKGANSNSICIEHLGNFNVNCDSITDNHSESVIDMAAALCVKFSIQADTNGILYHHWYNLATGERNNGAGGNKSCPGTFFFGGNKVEDCQLNFIPKVDTTIQRISTLPSPPKIYKYACVTANRLNIRIGPGKHFERASDRSQLTLGAIARIFDEQNGWYKISSSQEHWVSGRYCKDVRRARVNASSLNARSGPGQESSIIGSFLSGQEIFIEDEINNWCKISMENKWVNKSYLLL